jgi:hypothetical protein
MAKLTEQVRCEVPTATGMKVAVFWDVARLVC